MNTNKFSLDVVQVASPCSASWDDMKGDDRVRHCSHCQLNVFNLSELPRDEAEALVAQREGRLCVRFYRRTDGTIITRDCPIGLQAVRYQLGKMLAASATLLAAIIGGTLLARTTKSSLATDDLFEDSVVTVSPKNPLSAMHRWLGIGRSSNVRSSTMVMGVICVPQPPGPQQSPPTGPASAASEDPFN